MGPDDIPGPKDVSKEIRENQHLRAVPGQRKKGIPSRSACAVPYPVPPRHLANVECFGSRNETATHTCGVLLVCAM